MSPNDEIEDFRREIYEAGTHLASLVSAAFPDANTVSVGIACVLEVVEQYGLVGTWVTARITHTGEYMITEQIRDMSIIAFFVFRRCISLFSNHYLFVRLLCRPLSIAWRNRTSVLKRIQAIGGTLMPKVWSSYRKAIWSITVISFPMRKIVKMSGEQSQHTKVSMLIFLSVKKLTRISEKKTTRRTIMTMSLGSRSQRTTTWPTIR